MHLSSRAPLIRFASSAAAAAVALGTFGCGQPAPAPADQAPPPASSAPAATPAGKPLPDGAFKVEWDTSLVPKEMPAGQTIPVRVTFRNTSPVSWLDIKSADTSGGGPFAVRLSYRWWAAGSKTPLRADEGRADLPRPLGPGESASLTIDVTAPKEKGNWSLQFDLVQELVTWFEGKGVPKLVVPVKVK